MNKKLNTAIFLLVATVANLLILGILALLLALIFGAAYRNVEEVSMTMSWIAIIVIMFGSIGGTFYLYSKLVRWVADKWELEKYIDPIIKPKRR